LKGAEIFDFLFENSFETLKVLHIIPRFSEICNHFFRAFPFFYGNKVKFLFPFCEYAKIKEKAGE
jgi:hypothetical protein